MRTKTLELYIDIETIIIYQKQKIRMDNMLLIRAATILFGAILGFYAVQVIRKYRLNLKTISELRRINLYLDLEIEDLRAELKKYKKDEPEISFEETSDAHGSIEKPAD
ncbi:hypothetical protein [Desulfovibrio desulfuricans]|uniref:hypothetical protein n=1 Tax=Desulfovibrio desulfuricans TaxID=876 RepID=UPI001AE38907|nr:hypothetical protein [Desulfovibrio desulfuricans]MDD3684824.1 hypothetical protein [Desulfovibrio desulfuricans]QTO39305.1 hypothetical protein J8J02_09110 [Desulfovibrio desulfuricans]